MISGLPTDGSPDVSNETGEGWQPIATFDRTTMQFVLTYEDGEVRLYLWNPRGFWERPDPQCSRVPDYFRPSHWRKLPDDPEIAICPQSEVCNTAST